MAIRESFNWIHYDRIGSEWIECKQRAKHNIPAIYWKNHEPWAAANAFIRHKADLNSTATADSYSKHILEYANWLEMNNISWLHFPIREAERCLFRFRGYLIEQRNQGVIASSTASQRMNGVINFYKFARARGWIERKTLWKDVPVKLTFYNEVGFQRTMTVMSTDLVISSRSRIGMRLEEGLLPISIEARDTLLRILQTSPGDLNEILYLIHMIGFFTGARSQTIRTMTKTCLKTASDHHSSRSIKCISVGPGTRIKTKFDVSGELLVPIPLFTLLERYAVTPSRLERESAASGEDKNLLFITKNGRGYSDDSFNALMSEFRKKLIFHGHTQFHNFHFHQSRATYGTLMAQLAINKFPNITDAIRFVRDCMMHKDEKTTWKYIKFLKEQPVAEQFAKEFYEFFTGDSDSIDLLIDQVTYAE